MEMNKTAAQPKVTLNMTLKNDKVAADLGPEQPQTSEPTPTLKPSSQEENISSAVRSAWEKNFDVFGPIVQKNGFTRNLKADRIICGFPRNRQLVFLVQFGEIEEVVTQPDMKKYAPQLLIDFYIANLHDGPLENCKENFFEIMQHEIYQRPNYLSNSASPFGSFGDIFRFEDGSGDASGPLLGSSSYCGFGVVQGQGQGQGQNETEGGGVGGSGVGGQDENGANRNVTTMTTAMASSTMILSSRTSRFGLADMNRNVMDIGEQRQQQHQRQTTGISMSFSMLLARSLTAEPTRCMNPNIFPSVDGVPFIMLGQERFELEPKTIFVLGMRLNVTKNDILMFFSSVGMIEVNEHAKRPKIFVYKNRQTGRSKGEATITYISPFMAEMAIRCLNGSKFMGETITVLPAYLSTRKGRGIRYRYPREFAPSNNREQQQDRQQRRRQQRQRKWRPARDNWYCTSCRNSNFVWRSNCNRCKARKSEYAAEPNFSGSASFMKVARRWRIMKTDWECCYCFNKNFWYRQKCNRCHAPKAADIPKPVTPPRSDKWELELGNGA
ncbi:RNA-binding protein FUS isoform X2 [Drosophila tropicalis]|uniref:RNA-binding protein FUS isoform X2 n=1 Tax=Drosophila tropicalis TaxID=46794 RepID=UPI0035AC1042